MRAVFLVLTPKMRKTFFTVDLVETVKTEVLKQWVFQSEVKSVANLVRS